MPKLLDAIAALPGHFATAKPMRTNAGTRTTVGNRRRSYPRRVLRFVEYGVVDHVNFARRARPEISSWCIRNDPGDL